MLNKKFLQLLNSGNAVESAWEGLWNKIQPKGGFPPNQPIEMRKAFFCGFFSCFDILTRISDDLTETEAMKILDKLNAECVREVKKFGIPLG